jgi:hypothetical protein
MDNAAYQEVQAHLAYIYHGNTLPFVKINGKPYDLSDNDLGGALQQCSRH